MGKIKGWTKSQNVGHKNLPVWTRKGKYVNISTDSSGDYFASAWNTNRLGNGIYPPHNIGRYATKKKAITNAVIYMKNYEYERMNSDLSKVERFVNKSIGDFDDWDFDDDTLTIYKDDEVLEKYSRKTLESQRIL
jgi:hypothetical protein